MSSAALLDNRSHRFILLLIVIFAAAEVNSAYMLTLCLYLRVLTQINYRYLVQVMNLGPTGGIAATLDSFVVTVDILIDFNNDEIHLQEFALTDLG